jgi:methylthioribose-1-phosphate isomerase
VAQIPIEERAAGEVHHVWGRDGAGNFTQVRVTPSDSPAGNPAFDVTPARLVTGLITERGVVATNEAAMLRLFPEFA